MPKSYDQRPVAITHDPTQRLDTAVGKLPKLNPAQFFAGFLQAIKDFTGLDLTGPLALITSLGGVITSAIANVVKTAIGKLFKGVIPIGSLTDEPVELQDPKWSQFTDGSIAPSVDWSVDLAASRSADGSGAAKVTADGHPHALRSGETMDDVIPVGRGQTIEETVFIRHGGYTGTGPAVLLQVTPYDDAGRVGDHVTLASYSPLEAAVSWPGHKLTGSWVIPEGVTGYQKRYYVTPETTAGVFYFDDAAAVRTGKLRKEWIDGLPDDLADLLNRWQLQLDTIVNSLRGSNNYFHELSDLAQALIEIPASSISGVLGSLNLGNSVIEVLNSFVGGLSGQTGTTASPADAFNVAKMISAWASQGRSALELLGIRNAEPVASGMLATGDSNYPYANANTWLSVAPGAALGVTHRIGKSRPMGVVSWLGYGNTGITGFYVVVLKIGPTARTVVHVSPNLVSDLPPGSTVADADWVFYEIDNADTITQTAGDDFSYVLMSVGGTHHVWGLSYADDIPDHPYAQIKSLASSHNWTTPPTVGTTIARSAVVSSQDVLWIETAIETGNTASQHEPQLIYLGTEAATLFVPKWCYTVVPIVLGASGGGHLGGSFGFAGDPGEPGKYSSAIWRRNVDFTGDTTVTYIPGAGGTPGNSPFNQDGGDGQDSTMSIPGHSVTADGGTGGKSVRQVLLAGKPIGRGAGEYTIDEDNTLPGGGDQHALGGDGIPPGGGANGGDWLTVSAGGRGAPGGGWVLLLPADTAAGTPDLTPPTMGAVSVVGTTFSTITLEISGTTDA